jgi:hypothetical protein
MRPVVPVAARAAAAALVCLVLVLAPAQAGAAPRALVAFLPASGPDAERLLDQFSGRGMAVALLSPTTGGYSQGQTTLDLGQGSRISMRLYDGDDPPLRLQPEGRGGRLQAWPRAVERADDAPGDVVPGLLGETVKRAGGQVAYAGVAGGPQVEAAAAADEAGRIDRVSLVPARALGEHAAALWERSDLLVVRLPGGPAGLRALDRLLADRRAGDLVLAMRAPPAGEELKLLPAGIAGAGATGRARSDTTRRAGLVAATDVAPTVLEGLGLDVPDDMQGQRIETDSGSHAAQRTRSLGRRLDVIVPRRDVAMYALVLSWLALIALAALARGRAGVRLARRVAFLAALWVPGVALLTAALEPSRALEIALLVTVSLALGALVDRLVRWPVAPLIPAAVVFGAHAIDLAAGSPLTGLSLAGPNPKGGARFFGVGNELEAVLSLSVILGAGAGLTLAAPRRVPAGFAAACLVAAAVLGAGRLGADVGAVITLGAAAGAAIVLSRPGGATRRAVALAVALPLAALAGLVLLDVATGGGAHLTRSVLEAGGPGDLADLARRRFELSWRSLRHGLTPLSVAVAVLVLAAGFARRRELVAPLAGVPGWRAFVAGLGGALAATVAGAVSNDSGPVFVVVGAIALLLAAGYVQGGRAVPLAERRRSQAGAPLG